jgi:kynureninase
MMTDLAAWRREFPILESTTYLISNSLGAMPRGAAARLAEYAEIWATRGVRAWEEGWWEMPVAVGDLVAPLRCASWASRPSRPWTPPGAAARWP